MLTVNPEIDIDNFNHKFADTMVYMPVITQWVYLLGLSRQTLMFNTYVEGQTSLKDCTINIGKHPTIISKESPPPGYYNDFINGHSYLLSRHPHRVMKHTSSPRTLWGENHLSKILPGDLVTDLKANNLGGSPGRGNSSSEIRFWRHA